MECPKCRLVQPDSGIECPRCGLVFARYRPRPPREGEAATPVRTSRSGLRVVLDYLLFTKDPRDRVSLVGRAVVLLALLVWSWWFWLSPSGDGYVGRSFLHLVNLPFHEAGHVLFRPFGSFMTSLGGSLNQILIPLVCTTVLLVRTRDAFGASVALWWAGENFLDLAPYIGDARSMSLPLLGGNTGYSAPYGFHDWNYILNEAGVLDRDALYAGLSKGIGVTLMAMALVWGATVLLRAGLIRRSRPTRPGGGSA